MKGARRPDVPQSVVTALLIANVLVLAAAVAATPLLRVRLPLDRAPAFALATTRAEIPPAPPVAAPGGVGPFGVPVTAPAPAPPPTAPVATAVPLTRQQLGQAALSLIHYPWRDLGVNIAFLGPRSGYLGKTFPQQARIEMYVRAGESPVVLAYMTAHEIGHMVDWRYGTPARRQQWKALRHIPASTSWFGDAFAGGDDLGTPAGDFAETFAYWQEGPVDYKSRMGPPPTPADLVALTPLFVK